MTQPDVRVQELKDFEREEGIRLPLPVDLIVFFEKRGRVVDLIDGTVYASVTVATTPSAKAVCHLLTEVEGDILVT